MLQLLLKKIIQQTQFLKKKRKLKESLYKLWKMSNICLTFFCLYDMMRKIREWSDWNAKKKTRIK